jgi:hypothetical protein
MKERFERNKEIIKGRKKDRKNKTKTKQRTNEVITEKTEK